MNNLNELRDAVVERLGEYRAKHVLSTEEEAVKIASFYLPEQIEKVRICALLHDITKEYEKEKQLQIFSDFGIIIDNATLNSPKVWHAATAALIIPKEFPDFAYGDVINAIRNHTTGSPDMNLLDIILYLADYIEPLRKFDDCKKLREYFWSKIESLTTESEKLHHLYKTMVMSFDFTIKNLIAECGVIATDTVAARNAFVLKCASFQREYND